MNAFASYGEARARSRPAPADKPMSALDKKMQEKQRLSRAYRAWRRQDTRDTLAAEPRLKDFSRYLRSVQPHDADELIQQIGSSWLPASAQPVRILALRLVERRCDRLNRQIGNEALDDPLPPETNVFFRARDLLHAGGRA